MKLLEMTEQLDRMDQLDFEEETTTAAACTRKRDYLCAENALQKALKYANGDKDKKTLQSLAQDIAAERERQAAEEREVARREREIARLEAQMKEAEERMERRARAAAAAEDDSGMSAAESVALFSNLLSQSFRNQAAARMFDNARAAQLSQQRAQINASMAEQQQRFANERSRLQQEKATLLAQREQTDRRIEAERREIAARKQESDRLREQQAQAEANRRAEAERLQALQQRQDSERRSLQEDARRQSALLANASQAAVQRSGSSGPTAVANHLPQAGREGPLPAPYCTSHAVLIPYGKFVCFKSSMRQYYCAKKGIDYGLTFNQTLLMKSSLSADSCHHIDEGHDRPAPFNLLP